MDIARNCPTCQTPALHSRPAILAVGLLLFAATGIADAALGLPGPVARAERDAGTDLSAAAHARAMFLARAEAGDRLAMAHIGLIYLTGVDGLPIEYPQAFKWLSRGVEKGEPRAMEGLGVMYETGAGVAKNAQAALSLYRRAADTGGGDATDAMNLVGKLLLAGGIGLPKDEAQGVQWLRRAASRGCADAMRAIGGMYIYGSGGLPKDMTEALKWFRRAADAGEPSAMRDVGIMYCNGYGVAKDEEAGLAWVQKGVAGGSAEAMQTLASLYVSGCAGLRQDDSKALTWYLRAARMGNPRSMACVGAMYEAGRGGLEKNDVEALTWYHRAANANDSYAIGHIGYLYQNGLCGVERSDKEAALWYQRSADLGDGWARDQLTKLINGDPSTRQASRAPQSPSDLAPETDSTSRKPN